jgi:hypothetical protein
MLMSDHAHVMFHDTYDALIHPHIDKGHMFFEPQNFALMSAQEKLAAKHDRKNWTTNDGDMQKYKLMRSAMKTNHMVHKHKQDDEWYSWSADHKLAYLLHGGNWEKQISYSVDATVYDYREKGRIFFKPPNVGDPRIYSTLNQTERLHAHQNLKNWTTTGVAKAFYARKKAKTLNTARLDKSVWDTMSPDEKMHHLTKETNIPL